MPTGMIRPLEEQDRGAAIALLRSEPALNLYFLGNIEAIGFDAGFCQFWGDFDAGGDLRAILNRYRTGWIIYGRRSANWPALGEVVDRHTVPAERLQDNPSGVPSFLPYLTRYRASQIREEQMMILKGPDFRPRPLPTGSCTVRRANRTDLPNLIDLYANAGHMSRTAAQVEHPLHQRRIWVAEQDTRLISVALTNAETADSAMIGGVFTPPDQRCRGYSQAVISALCEELLSEGKQPVLYWDTPAAGAVYRKLGFQQTGTWRSVRLEKL